MSLLLKKKDGTDWLQEEKDILTLSLLKPIIVNLKAVPQTIRVDDVSFREIADALGHNQFYAEEV